MPFFGPKTVDAKGDTVYWSVPEKTFATKIFVKEVEETDSVGQTIVTARWKSDTTRLDTVRYPIYVMLFLNENLRKEGYKLAGLYDYIKYKNKDLQDIPLFMVSSFEGVFPDWDLHPNDGKETEVRGTFDSLKINLPNFIPLYLQYNDRDSALNATYFKQKPVYVFDYFMVLVDKKRHIRGYYDPTYNAEVKRMIDEYKHLKIRDEYAQTLKQNDIKKK